MYEQDRWELREAARRDVGPAADTAPVELFPVFARPTARVTAARRRALRAHLERQHAGVEAAPASPRTPAAAALDDLPVGSICAQCRGFCCVAGGDHGLLTTANLRRTASIVPGDIVEHYLTHVPRRAYAGSCIFHTVTGCALPRELRSDTCNRYLCEPLTRLARGSVEDPGRVVIAGFDQPGRDRRVAIVRDLTARAVRHDRAAGGDGAASART